MSPGRACRPGPVTTAPARKADTSCAPDRLWYLLRFCGRTEGWRWRMGGWCGWHLDKRFYSLTGAVEGAEATADAPGGAWALSIRADLDAHSSRPADTAIARIGPQGRESGGTDSVPVARAVGSEDGASLPGAAATDFGEEAEAEDGVVHHARGCGPVQDVPSLLRGDLAAQPAELLEEGGEAETEASLRLMRAVERVGAAGGHGPTGAGDDGNVLLGGEQFLKGACGHDLLPLRAEDRERPGVQDKPGDEPERGTEQHPAGERIREGDEPSPQPQCEGRGPEEQAAGCCPQCPRERPSPTAHRAATPVRPQATTPSASPPMPDGNPPGCPRVEASLLSSLTFGGLASIRGSQLRALSL